MMPLNRMLQSAMQANQQQQQAGNQAGRQQFQQEQQDRTQQENLGFMNESSTDRQRREIEMIKRKITEMKVQAARNPEMAQEMEARIAFAMDKLMKLEEAFDRLHGPEGQRSRNDERVQQAEQRQMAQEERRSASEKANREAMTGGGGGGEGGGGETGPGGMTEGRWAGMSRGSREAFLGSLPGQSGTPGVPSAGRPWWMTLNYGGEGTQEKEDSSAGASTQLGMGGGSGGIGAAATTRQIAGYGGNPRIGP